MWISTSATSSRIDAAVAGGGLVGMGLLILFSHRAGA